ncbi:MAG: hypothetical protein ACMUIM_02120 [bacterium]
MKKIKYWIFASVILITACAQVPKEAVELSVTVGRDMAEMKRAHIAFVNLYYEQLLNDINRFIDDVYMPYQVQKTLSDDIWKNEMLMAIESASQPDTTGVKQKESMQKIEAFLQILHEEVESYRKAKTDPVKAQQQTILDNIQESYERIHYANSIVTGHLASVVKVHDTQNEILKELDLENLREKVGVKVTDISDDIGELIREAKEKEDKLNEIVNKFEGLMKKVK